MIYIGADHGGFELKEYIKQNFKEDTIVDKGYFEKIDLDFYPEVAKEVCKEVLNNNSLGILTCGTGEGMLISSNKFRGIRACLAYDEYTAQKSKEHNNCNILILGERTIKDYEYALKLIEIWYNSKFLGGKHKERIDLIEKEEYNKF